MSTSNAVAKLQAAAALWSLDPSDAEAVIRAACDALALGVDTPSLGMLAAMSINELTRSGHEIAEVLEAAFEELGVPYLPPGSIAGRDAAVLAMALRVLDHDISPRALTSWAHSNFGHDLPLAESLAELDDVYDCMPYTDLSPDEIDADVRAAAEAIVGRFNDEGAGRVPDPCPTHGSTRGRSGTRPGR
ncbi:hypothetical protein [Micromonospora sp. NPDC047740]|uniref:hypothetical protein n=1 Tax=Micromonospora sp. NPDC047740 TaxID=3364254 RepID=UPI003715F367